MLRIVLLLRISLILTLSLFLWSCASKQIVPAQLPDTRLQALNCPSSLIGLRDQQAIGSFLYCDPEKDGSDFIDENNPYLTNANLQSVWILIDTEKQQLEIKRGNDTLQVFSNIAVGRNGAGFKTHRGDNITPIGEYKIGWVNDQSKFHLFYGLTYPSIRDATEGFRKGVISATEYQAIIYAHQNNQIPPQNTMLGGQVGLHGLGFGDELVHQKMNWTQGCIALTNSQIDELDQWIVEGMRVKIK